MQCEISRQVYMIQKAMVLVRTNELMNEGQMFSIGGTLDTSIPL